MLEIAVVLPVIAHSVHVESLEALHHETADVLVGARDFGAPAGWTCASCGLIKVEAGRPRSFGSAAIVRRSGRLIA